MSASTDRKVARLLDTAREALRARRLSDAVRDLERALALAPGNLAIAMALVRTLEQGSDHAATLKAAVAAQKIAPRDPTAVLALSRALARLDQLPTALRAGRLALELDPGSWPAAAHLIELLLRANDAAAARDMVGLVAQLHPDRPEVLNWALQCVPRAYRDVEEIARVRTRFRADLARFAERIPTLPPPARARLARDIEERSNFYVHYQGLLEVEDQRTYGGAVASLVEGRFPAKIAAPPARTRPRVAFVSSHLRFHTVGKLFGGFVTGHDPAAVEVYVYQVGGPKDEMGRGIAAAAACARDLPMNLEAIVEAVRADAPDVVIFTDIGMLGLMTLVAAVRLAPVQCVLWGHPVTTGLPAVDVFLSASGMEPADGAAHVTERLVCLPGIGIDYARPPAPPQLTRAHFGLPEEAPVFLSCQSMFKYLPQRDDLYAAVAEAVPDSVFAFLRHPDTEVCRTFVARMTAVFAARGMVFEQRARLLPRLSSEPYLALNACADVFLDTPDWSGGNTCLEALAMGLPVVTLPGPYMRGRHSAAMVRELGLDALVARDAADYVRIAVRLATDTAWRTEVRAHILARADGTLFGNPAAVRALEAFVVSAWSERASRTS